MSVFDTLSCMPERVTSGDTVSVALAALSVSYPVGLYTLQVVVRGGAANPITADLADSGGLQSGDLDFAGAAAGSYSYVIKATRVSDDVVRTVERGTLIVDADPTTQDTRSHAERTLDAIEALIEGRATTDVASYSIAGRSLSRMTPDELVKWRSVYRAEVAAQRNAGKPNGGRKITLARFK
jgi:hypothetical protein